MPGGFTPPHVAVCVAGATAPIGLQTCTKVAPYKTSRTHSCFYALALAALAFTFGLGLSRDHGICQVALAILDWCDDQVWGTFFRSTVIGDSTYLEVDSEPVTLSNNAPFLLESCRCIALSQPPVDMACTVLYDWGGMYKEGDWCAWVEN